jgi:opacity protein-like surface antigen
MKRFLATITVLMMCFSSGAAASAESATPVPAASVTPGKASAGGIQIDLEIEEETFLTQLGTLFDNVPDYLGKTIALEGIFDEFTNAETGTIYRTVCRKMAGYDSSEGIVGLEVAWDDPAVAYPAVNEWVRAVGVLEQYEENGAPYLELRLISLDVKTERGLEVVTQ